MKYFLISVFLVFSSSVIGQENSEIRSYSTTMQLGELVRFGNRSLKFKKVVSDSRCPINVTCIWAGEAKVLVEIFENGRCIKEMELLVTSNSAALNFISNSIAYSVNGFDLMPYPTTQDTKTQPDYNLKMWVSEEL